ncbi:replication restart helicase PriA [Anaeromicropila populeti]|uniref:Replication restart protein PriA n=1 Tax=Anaeromicropila populeti TaxID=37658 RepID=A0A1I6KWM5_9FIRM|nr:primosomal protein N' [Anaeromicropila populeti]SFR95574.1 replication restart DNA helicase PriA [Anaeromicropila populeti]
MYADIIVDISHENLDKTYQYAVPAEWEKKAVVGSLVKIPFGKGERYLKGYIVSLSEYPKIPLEKIKCVLEVVENGLAIESQLIKLAFWIKDNYGATMNDALKTVIPVKRKVKQKENKRIILAQKKETAVAYLAIYQKKHHTAKVRLLEALLADETLDFEMVTGKLNISRETIKTLEKDKLITVKSSLVYRNPVRYESKDQKEIILNESQQKIADCMRKDYLEGIRKTYYIHGITGSGKTEIYMDIISSVVEQGKQVIMLIPEISLTYQTVMRFYHRFGGRVSFLHSRLSGGERYDQYVRAKNGEVDIMIGPRSALFTPFEQLGLIILDEEHETSYKSDSPPKYHAREVAIERARMTGSSVILGSATPSIESYKKALEGEYQLFHLTERANDAVLPKVWVADLREELKNKNKSIFSRKLSELITDRLAKKEQIMLFINRRGYAGFVSCRSCGYVMKCPHCDVSLTSHNNGKLICHYCGYEVEMVKKCPGCGSNYIAAFGTGTQKVEELVKKAFPEARVLRMDTDTTSKKEGHEKILAAFSNQEGDILVGTQMIVKGHDFPNVTLVGILAADLSLYSSDYKAAERTFQLLTQASGRAGRGKKQGEVVIQTYNPEHYSVITASTENYEEFYRKEMLFRSMMSYPPVEHMVAIMVSAKEETYCFDGARSLAEQSKLYISEEQGKIIGPVKASVSKVKDIYRWIVYIKCKDYEVLKKQKDQLEEYMQKQDLFRNCSVQFDFDPVHSY